MKMSRFFGFTSFFLGSGFLLAARADDSHTNEQKPPPKPKNPLLEALIVRPTVYSMAAANGHFPFFPPLSTLQPLSSMKADHSPPLQIPTLPPIDLSKLPNLMDVPPQMMPFDVEELEKLSEFTQRIAQAADILIQGAQQLNATRKSAASASLDNENIAAMEQTRSAAADQPTGSRGSADAAARPPGRGDGFTFVESLIKYVIFGLLFVFALLCCWFVRKIGIKKQSTAARSRSARSLRSSNKQPSSVSVIPALTAPSARETSNNLISI